MKQLFLSFGLGLSLFLFSCKTHQENKEIPTYAVTSPIVKDTAITREYVCQVRAINHIELRSQERGYLQNIYIGEGQFVHKGQLLFRIMPNVYQAEANKASAETRVAEIEYQTTKSLADRNVVSSNELAMTKAKLEKAKANYALAQTHLGFTEIRAPFDGIIDRFRVRLGSLLEEGDLLTTLSDNSKLWVYFNVPESEYLSFSAKEKTDKPQVQLKMANGEIFQNPGVVETIEADFDNETGNIAFRATFQNIDNLLRHGETGNILMKVPFRNAIIIPQMATFEILDKKYVYVVDKNNVVYQRGIEVAATLPELFIVASGVQANDRILMEGLRKARDKDVIHPKYEAPAQVYNHLEAEAD